MTKEQEPKHFMIRLDPAFHLALKRHALEEGKPLSEVIADWIKAGWQQVPNRENYERPKS